MRTLLVFAAVAFALLPYDAQLWLLSGLRDAWLTDGGRSVLIGLAAGCLPALFFYAAGWNALAARLYRDDVGRAEKAYKERQR